jgi:hypothetical protein
MNIEELKKQEGIYPLAPADPDKIPGPTFWPVFTAFGVLFIFWGLITSFILFAVGIIVTGISISGWVSDLNNS